MIANSPSTNYQRNRFDTYLTAEWWTAPWPRSLGSAADMSSEPQTAGALDADIRVVLFREILVAVLFNALVFPFIIWLVDLKPPATLGGADGVVASFTKATVLTVLLMTVILTMVWRKRVATGVVPAVRSGALAWLKFVPRNVAGRALLFVLAAQATLMPLGVAVCMWFELYPMSKQGFAMVNVCYGAVIGSVVTPFITLAAMAERRIAERKGVSGNSDLS
jgi:hypothetical protein